MPASRRTFLSAAAGAAFVHVPSPVKGFASEEVAALAESGRLAEVGVSKWELDTPALCVDLDQLEGNVARMQAR